MLHSNPKTTKIQSIKLNKTRIGNTLNNRYITNEVGEIENINYENNIKLDDKVFVNGDFSSIKRTSLSDVPFLNINDVIEVNSNEDGFRVVTLRNGDKMFFNQNGTLNYILNANGFNIKYNDNKVIDIIDTNSKNQLSLNVLIKNNLSNCELDLTSIKYCEQKDDGSLVVKFENGITASINKKGHIDRIMLSDGTIIMYDNSGNLLSSCHLENGIFVNINCYDQKNKLSYQYGSSQMDFTYHTDELLQDPIILSKLKETYPDASMEQYELYLKKICNTGCGYAVLVNTIFNEYTGREDEFYNIFGFDMYKIDTDGKLDYNYEYLILDYFNYAWSYKYDIEELIADVSDESTDLALSGEEIIVQTGTDDYSLNGLFDKYMFKRYNIELESNLELFENDEDCINKCKELIKNGHDNIYIVGKGFDLISTKEDTEEPIRHRDIGAHAMSVTGINKDGNLIVSSWGEEYIIDLSEVEKREGFIGLGTIDYK